MLYYDSDGIGGQSAVDDAAEASETAWLHMIKTIRRIVYDGKEKTD